MSGRTEHSTARVEAGIGNGREGYYEVRSDGDGLVYQAPGNGEVRLVPTAGEWASFWATVDRLGGWEWQERYEDRRVCDGTYWAVTLEHEGRVLESTGANAYPGGDDWNEPGEAFSGFCQAVGRLVGGRTFR